MRCFALFCGLLRSPPRLLSVWAAIACLYGCMPKPLLAAFYAEYRSSSEFFGCRRPSRGFRWVPAPLFVEFGSENLGCDYSFPEVECFDRPFYLFAFNCLLICGVVCVCWLQYLMYCMLLLFVLAFGFRGCSSGFGCLHFARQLLAPGFEVAVVGLDGSADDANQPTEKDDEADDSG